MARLVLVDCTRDRPILNSMKRGRRFSKVSPQCAAVLWVQSGQHRKADIPISRHYLDYPIGIRSAQCIKICRQASGGNWWRIHGASRIRSSDALSCESFSCHKRAKSIINCLQSMLYRHAYSDYYADEWKAFEEDKEGWFRHISKFI
jgi:hypothetical protein